MAFGRATATTRTTRTTDTNINALIATRKWTSNRVTYSAPTSINDYERNYPDRDRHRDSFQSLNLTQRDAINQWVRMLESVSGLDLVENRSVPRDATIRMAKSLVPGPGAAFAYLPGSAVYSGDVWFRQTGFNTPIIGNRAFYGIGHELGHALGLKHGHEQGGVAGVALTSDRDSTEFSIMTYRAYIGDDDRGISLEANSYAQSLMMYDIAALQHMYGPNFTHNSGNTRYSFFPSSGRMFINGSSQGNTSGNRIFRTIWDGNGIDTYDFSAYTTNVFINLDPGRWTDLDLDGNHQRANLGNGNVARGHVFNALQYKGDRRSLIENADGGSGNDNIGGNIANNLLKGNDGDDRIDGGGFSRNFGSGNDTLYGGNGNDFLDGDDGNDTLYGNNSAAGGGLATETNILQGEAGHDRLYGSDGRDRLNGGSGNDLIIGNGGNDIINGGTGFDRVSFQYSGRVVANLSTGQANSQDGIDTLISIEHLTGSLGADTLIGNAFSNTIYGYFGNDVIDAGRGTDRTYGEQGSDRIIDRDGINFDVHDGGSSIDTIDYSRMRFIENRATINLATEATTFSNSTWRETIRNFENVEGSQGSESIIGSTSNNHLAGNSGNDRILGQGGFDTLIGGNGDDILDSDTLSAVDTLGDLLDGGAGNDRLQGEAGHDRLFGGTGDDVLTGDDSASRYGHDRLDGGAGTDSLNGGSGRDLLLGGSGSDTLVGGSHNDTLNGYGGTVGEYDILTGDNRRNRPNIRNTNDGGDRFILGDTSRIFYLGQGFATLKDFFGSEGDRLQLKGRLSDYSLRFGQQSGTTAQDTLIYRQSDLIAVVEDNTTVSTTQDLVFV